MPKSQVTVRLDKAQLARAQRVLGAKTVTEAIEQALALATEKAAHDAIFRKYSGVGRKRSFADG
jgi:Arc/MetJ family transcription regulator